MMHCIVKIQMPIFGNGTEALIYNEDKSFCVQMPLPKDAAKIMRDSKKMFFNVLINGDTVEIVSKALWQSW